MSPAGDFDHDDARTGRYRTAPPEATGHVSYSDVTIALTHLPDSPRVTERQVSQSPFRTRFTHSSEPVLSASSARRFADVVFSAASELSIHGWTF